MVTKTKYNIYCNTSVIFTRNLSSSKPQQQVRLTCDIEKNNTRTLKTRKAVVTI